MNIRKTFTVDGLKFDFTNNLFSGEETFCVDGEVLSSRKSHFGGKHEFTYRGDSYGVQVKPGIVRIKFKVIKNAQEREVVAEKDHIPAAAHFLCGWPLVLLLIGGAIGGGLGGAAYFLNRSIYSSDTAVPLKYILILAVGIVAVVVWAMAAMAIHGYFA